MTTITLNNDVVIKLQKNTRTFRSGYGAISGNVDILTQLPEDQKTLDNIAEYINASLVGMTKDDAAPLDKAYMMASKRKLGSSFGVKWNEDLERCEFRLPTKEVSRRKDPFKQAVAKFIAAGATDKEKATVMRLMAELIEGLEA